jgi:hypothetical protein
MGPGRGRVLVVDGGGSTRCALLGDMLGNIAAKNGWWVLGGTRGTLAAAGRCNWAGVEGGLDGGKAWVELAGRGGRMDR